ncbi:MAG: hypothetical protein KAW93_09220, partial [Methanogenium sp.]|nr:hypothetical protein [Methanogenium sp.]
EWVLNMNYSNQAYLNGNNPGSENIASDERDIPPLRALRSEVFNELPAGSRPQAGNFNIRTGG